MATENKGAIIAGVGAAGLLLWWLMGRASAAEGGCKPAATDGKGNRSTRDNSNCAKAGVASNPSFQWQYIVQEGDSPTRITKRYLGTDNREAVNPSSSARTAYVELIDENPDQGTVGDRNNPWTSGFNFYRFNAGDVINLPRAWNAYIDEQGNPRGQLSPFPLG